MQMPSPSTSAANNGPTYAQPERAIAPATHCTSAPLAAPDLMPQTVVSDVTVTGREKRRAPRNGADALVEAGARLALNAWLRESVEPVAQAVDALRTEALTLENQRSPHGAAERVNAREVRLLEQVRFKSGRFDDTQLAGAIQKAAGELICNGLRAPQPWDDALDPGGLRRDTLDHAALPNTVFEAADDAPPVVAPPPALPRFDVQLSVPRIRCIEETGLDWAGSDEFSIVSAAMYSGGRVQTSDYGAENFDSGQTRNLTKELLRARVQFRAQGLTTLNAVFAPVEREFLTRANTLTVLTTFVNVLVEAGAAALSQAVAQVPTAGRLLAAIVNSDAVKDAVRLRLMDLAEDIAEFLADDRFSLYTFDAFFAWANPLAVPVVSGRFRAMGRAGQDVVADLPPAPVTVRRVVAGVPTVQVTGTTRRRIADPGFYLIDQQLRTV